MPNPSASSPPQRSRHSIANTSAARCASGRSSSETRPRNRTRSARPRGAARFSSRARSRPPPTIATITSAGSVPSASMQHVEALARDEPARAEHDAGVDGEAEMPARGVALGGVGGGPEAVDVDARAGPRARATAPRRVLGLARAGTRRPRPRRRRRATRRRAAVGSGSRPGHRDLGAVEHHDRRRGVQRAARSDRAAAPGPRRSRRPRPRAPARRRRAPGRASASSTGSRRRSTRNACCASHAPSPA